MTEQEIKPCEFVSGACIHCEATERKECEGWVCLPQRQWVGLTEEEIDYQAKKDDHGAYFALGALWAGAKLKEKNYG
jgi:hypothetical protein